MLAGLAAVALLVSLFLPWYQLAGIDVTATEAFGFIDIWLLIVAGMGIALPLVTAIKDTPALPIAMDVLTSWVAFLGVLLVLFRTLNLPGPEGVDRQWGLWVGLAACVGTLAGAYWAMRRQDSPGLRPNPEPELQPAPPA